MKLKTQNSEYRFCTIITYTKTRAITQGYSRKKYLGGEDGRRYIFLWVVGAESFQIIWVVGVRPNLTTWVVGVSPNLITCVVGIFSFAKLKKMDFTCH